LLTNRSHFFWASDLHQKNLLRGFQLSIRRTVYSVSQNCDAEEAEQMNHKRKI